MKNLSFFLAEVREKFLTPEIASNPYICNRDKTP